MAARKIKKDDLSRQTSKMRFTKKRISPTVKLNRLTVSTLEKVDILKDSPHRVIFFNSVLPKAHLESIRSVDNRFKTPLFGVVSNIPEVVGYPLSPFDPWFGQIIACSTSTIYLNRFLFWLASSAMNTKFGVVHDFKYYDDHYPEFKILTLKDVHALIHTFRKVRGKDSQLEAIWADVLNIYGRALMQAGSKHVFEPIKPLLNKFSGEEFLLTDEDAEKLWNEVLPLKKGLEPFNHFLVQTEEDFLKYNWGLSAKAVSEIEEAMKRLEGKFGLNEEVIKETLTDAPSFSNFTEQKFGLVQHSEEDEMIVDEFLEAEFDFEVDVFDSSFDD